MGLRVKPAMTPKFVGISSASTVSLLTIRAIINRAAQICFFLDNSATYRAGQRQSVFAQNSFIAAGVAVKIFFGIASTLFRHDFQHIDDGMKKRVFLAVREGFDFPLRMNAGSKKNVLQNSVAKTGKSLLGRKKRLYAQCLFARHEKRIEI